VPLWHQSEDPQNSSMTPVACTLLCVLPRRQELATDVELICTVAETVYLLLYIIHRDRPASDGSIILLKCWLRCVTYLGPRATGCCITTLPKLFTCTYLLHIAAQNTSVAYCMWFIVTAFSALTLCWLGGRKGILPVKNWVVGCCHGYLSGVQCRLA